MRAQDIPKAGEIYRHFKGNLYQILHITRHTETGELIVNYKNIDPASEGTEWEYCGRPLSMWADEVLHEGKYVPRFEKLTKSQYRRIAAHSGVEVVL